MNSHEQNIMLMVIYGIVLLSALIIDFVIYVYKGRLLYRICKRNGMKQKWLAWIPVGNDYVLLKSGEISTKLIWVFAAELLCSLIANYDAIGDMWIFEVAYFIISVLECIFTIQALKKITEKYQKGKVLLAVTRIYFVGVLATVLGLFW